MPIVQNVEEALANAVYHKSYELSSPIEVQIWPDKIEILSFPGPVPPISAKILEEHRRIVARDYRNRRVGDFLKELHLTEGRGTGIPIIYDMMEKNGSPKPDFDTDDACTYFLTVLHSHPELILSQSDKEDDQANDQGSDQDGVQVTDQEVRVLQLCNQPHSRTEIFEMLGVSNHHANYKRNIEPLLEKQWLKMTIPDKPTSGNQKYQTTPKGQMILQNTEQVSVQATDQDSDQDADQVVTVLELCKQPHSRKEILKSLGLSNHHTNYQHYIEPLLERNWLELTVPDKPKSPNQKYKTTKKGLNVLQESKRS